MLLCSLGWPQSPVSSLYLLDAGVRGTSTLDQFVFCSFIVSLLIFFLHLFVAGEGCLCHSAYVDVWRHLAEDESLLPTMWVPEIRYQVIMLGNKHLYPPNRLADPFIDFLAEQSVHFWKWRKVPNCHYINLPLYIANMKNGRGTGSISQSGKCLLHRLKLLCPCEQVGVVVRRLILTLGRQRQADPWGWLSVSQAELMSSRSKQDGSWTVPTCVYMYVPTLTHTGTWMHQHVSKNTKRGTL